MLRMWRCGAMRPAVPPPSTLASLPASALWHHYACTSRLHAVEMLQTCKVRLLHLADRGSYLWTASSYQGAIMELSSGYLGAI